MSSKLLSGSSSPLALTREAETFTASATLYINETVAQKRARGESVIHLGFGQASFPLPESLHASLVAAARSTGYAPVAGIKPLRATLAAYLKRTRKIDVGADDVIIGPGSKTLLYALMRTLTGDLMLPVPRWVSYVPQAKMAGKQVVDVSTEATDRQTLTASALNKALKTARDAGADPRILLITSPNNPTGGMFDAENVREIAEWSRANGITVISDEIYAETGHGTRPHVSPAQFYPEGTIVTGGISKSFSAGGWRLGYAALPKDSVALRKAILGFASETWSAASTPVQEAAIAAFEESTELDAYLSVCSFAHGVLANSLHEVVTKYGATCPQPHGAFYLYPDFGKLRDKLAKKGVKDNILLAEYLLREFNIATLPGVEFGEAPEGLCLRMSSSMLLEASGTSPAAVENAKLFQALLTDASLHRDGTSPVLRTEETTVAKTKLVQTVSAAMEEVDKAFAAFRSSID